MLNIVLILEDLTFSEFQVVCCMMLRTLDCKYIAKSECVS